MKPDTPQEARRDRMTFYPVIVMSTIFCISIFIVIAATFGDQNVTVNRWVNQNANIILISETVLLIMTAVGAMTVDRVRTLKQLAELEEQKEDSTEATENVQESEIQTTTEVKNNVD